MVVAATYADQKLIRIVDVNRDITSDRGHVAVAVDLIRTQTRFVVHLA